MKKMLVVIMTLVMFLPLSLFASGAGEGGAQASAELDSKGRFLKTREITVEAWDRSVQGLPADNNFWTQYIAEGMLRDHNVKVTFKPVSRWDENNLIHTLLAAGTAPDISITFNFAAIQEFDKQGGVQDLAPLIKKYRSYLNDLFTLVTETNIYANLDAETGRLPWIEARKVTNDRPIVFVREDWLAKLNLKAPTTQAQFEAMLKAFKDNASTLLGADAGKMIPLCIGVDVGWRAEPLMISKIPDAITDEQTYVFGFDDRRLMWPNYKEGVRVLNKWYNEGLIWKDFPLYPIGDTFEDNLVKAGYVGALMHSADQPYRGSDASIQVQLQKTTGNPAAAYIAVDTFQNDKGKYRKWLPSPATADRKIFFPVTNDEPLASLLYLNWISKLENYSFLQLGKEGISHQKLADGSVKTLPQPAGSQYSQSGNLNFDITLTLNGLWLGSTAATNKSIANTYASIAPKYVTQAYTVLYNDAKYVPYYKLGTVQAESGLGTVLTNKRNTFLTNAIVAPVSEFDSVYDAGYKDYLASGGQAIIDERQAKWNASKKK